MSSSPQRPPETLAETLDDMAPRMPPNAAAMAARAQAAGAPATASSLIDEGAGWLPFEPERKTAFLQVFRYWHSQVKPEHSAEAKPALLFLITALPVMIKARDDLRARKLWDAATDQARLARDDHPAWRKYCEFLPRAQQALQELEAFKRLSLITALDDIARKLEQTDKAYRGA